MADKKPVNVIGLTPFELKRLWYNKVPLIGITNTATHESPHNDEIVGTTILREYGQSLFPECKNFGIGFISNKMMESIPEKNRFWNLLGRGILCIGCAGGPFDEHTEELKYTECSATLIAKHLGVNKNIELKDILRYTLYSDLNGDTFFDVTDDKDQEKRLARNAAQRLLPSAIIKAMQKTCASDDYAKVQENIQLIIDYYMVRIRVQRLFQEASKDIRNNNSLEVKRINGRILAIVKSDSRQAAQIANNDLKKRGMKSTLVVVINSKNQFSILNDLAAKHDIETLVCHLRTIWCTKNNVPVPDRKILGLANTLREIPGLHYHKNAQNFYNGTTSQPDVEGLFGSVITMEDLVSAFSLNFPEQPISQTVNTEQVKNPGEVDSKEQ